VPERDAIDCYLEELARALHVHGPRKRRILAEAAQHLRECAETHGADEAIDRFGPPETVAASFTPGPLSRAYGQRDRIAASVLVAAMAASVPLAARLHSDLEAVGSHVLLPFLVLLAPTALVALASAVLVLRRSPLGTRLAKLLAVMVAVTAVVTAVPLPPASGVFSGYREAVASGVDVTGCNSRTAAACASDHAWEVRVNYTLGALLLTGAYLWAVTGWEPRRRRQPQTA
jgi:HAAS domain-containing protein